MGQLVNEIAGLQNYEEFAELNWRGNFEDYLGLVKKNQTLLGHRFSGSTTWFCRTGQRDLSRQ